MYCTSRNSDLRHECVNAVNRSLSSDYLRDGMKDCKLVRTMYQSHTVSKGTRRPTLVNLLGDNVKDRPSAEYTRCAKLFFHDEGL